MLKMLSQTVEKPKKPNLGRKGKYSPGNTKPCLSNEIIKFLSVFYLRSIKCPPNQKNSCSKRTDILVVKKEGCKFRNQFY